MISLETNNPTPWWVMEMLAKFKTHGHDYKATDITCKTCKKCNECPYAWDIYNTNGDCLGLK